MQLDYFKILEDKLFVDYIHEIPSDLNDKINELANVKRFDFTEYPKNVIVDDTRSHTVKCICLATKLLTQRFNQNLVLRTLWIHDIPESVTKDVTVIEKSRDENLTKHVEEQEMLAAAQLLNTSDLKLLENFNIANEFLKDKREWDADTVSNEALFAKLIDNYEGNMTFNYFVAKWVGSEMYNPSLAPPDDALTHAFITGRKFSILLKQIPSAQYAEDLQKIVDLSLENIRNFWTRIEYKRIPAVLKDYL
jgi:hypothetical protein